MNGSVRYAGDGRSMYGIYMIKRVRKILKPGRTYRIPVETGDGAGQRRTFYVPMTLIACYPNFCLFKRRGRLGYIRESIKYMEVANAVVPEEYKEALMNRLRPEGADAGIRGYQKRGKDKWQYPPLTE